MRSGLRSTIHHGLAALALLVVCFARPDAAYSQVGFDTTAPAALLIDYNTSTVLLEKNADQAVPPASLTKLMTLEVLFHELQQGKVSLDDTFTASEHAWRSGGPKSGSSTMFLQPGEVVTIGDLIQGIAVQSGNDAAVTIAEGLAGTEAAFAERMNARAKEIGLSASHFVNPHGLPHPNEHVTTRDMARLAAHLIRTYPERYTVFREAEFTHNKVRQHNRNPALAEVPGADGLKTGHTEESGYSLVASATRDGRRLVLAMSGLKTARARAEEARKLMEYGFRAFEEITVAQADKPVGEARVYGGASDVAPLVPHEPINVIVPKGQHPDHLNLNIVYEKLLAAPLAKGEQVATLRVVRAEGPEDQILREVPLYSGAAVAQGTLVERAWDAAVEFVTQQWQNLGATTTEARVTSATPL
ncbi:D-alanyl-D-alanine carboxypeptidase family protein [Microvirga arabica]|uniref:serine-type D-Ala-D-Ala carboxypeptidase n=1 Tax=Microvirga arabica TaxID=1128671 RepID=A0ABV6Y427_9HYPH